jgi:hypothetical protein
MEMFFKDRRPAAPLLHRADHEARRPGFCPLYRSVALRSQIAPSQHTEEAFKRILGGATSIVEGLGPLRNKIGDVHGQGGKLSGQAPATPSAVTCRGSCNVSGRHMDCEKYAGRRLMP